jgi:hypothetical protein
MPRRRGSMHGIADKVAIVANELAGKQSQMAPQPS